MKYVAIVVLGCILVVFVALTYESQLLASVTAALIGAAIASWVVFTWAKDHLDRLQ